MSAVAELTKIEDALRQRRFSSARDMLAEVEPADTANLLAAMEASDRAVLFRLLPRPLAADVFEYLPPQNQEELLKALGREHVAAILDEMAPDDRTALLEELPAKVTRRLLNLLSYEERQTAKKLLGYPEESIGRLMTPDYVAVRPYWTVEKALSHIRRYGHDSETLNVIYVVDKSGRLLDDLRIRQLLLAAADEKIENLCDGHFVPLQARDDQESAVKVFAEYDRVAFPVVDSEGLLLGIVTIDDVLDVVEEEATEDMQKMAGMEALEQPYLSAGTFEMIRKRGGWLIVFFLGQMLTANVLGFFEDEIAQAMLLVLFLPLIISSGGNSGSQAATIVIRAMAVGELSLAHWWAVMRREIVSGLTLGLAIGAIGALRVVGGAMVTEAYPDHWPWIALTVGAALVGVVLWGSLLGSMLPLLLRAAGLDPATSSTPFVTTVIDVTGLAIYFSIAAAVF